MNYVYEKNGWVYSTEANRTFGAGRVQNNGRIPYLGLSVEEKKKNTQRIFSTYGAHGRAYMNLEEYT